MTASIENINKEEEQADIYQKQSYPVRDFVTLIRNVIITKLTTEKEFTTRQFLSSDGSQIFLVLYSNINRML